MMGKRRTTSMSNASLMNVEIKSEKNDSEVVVARDRLKGALRELLHHSDSESTGDSGNEAPVEPRPPRVTKPREPTSAQKRTPSSQPRSRMIKRRRIAPIDTPFHHTYVMKLFDRSVDLAQFREDTPLFPICRAWIANQPRNPNFAVKERSPSPELPQNDNDNEDEAPEITDVYRLPPPLPAEEAIPRNRIPSPTPFQVDDELDIDYEGQELKSKETLLAEHREHWGIIRKKWNQQANKNEKRFAESANILTNIFKKAQSEFE